MVFLSVEAHLAPLAPGRGEGSGVRGIAGPRWGVRGPLPVVGLTRRREAAKEMRGGCLGLCEGDFAPSPPAPHPRWGRVGARVV